MVSPPGNEGAINDVDDDVAATVGRRTIAEPGEARLKKSKALDEIWTPSWR
jgi:hypothetical protein